MIRLLLLMPLLSFANPNTKTYQVFMEAKFIKGNKIIMNHEAPLVLEFNAMEERCFLTLKDRRKFRENLKPWDCKFRSQKETPNLAYKDFLKIFEETYKVIKKKDPESLENYKTSKTKIFLNGKKVNQTYLTLELLKKYEISYRNTEDEGLNLVKINLRVY